MVFRCAGRVDRLQKGIRCDPPLRWVEFKSGAAPATVGGESFFRLPLGFVHQSLGRRRRIYDPRARRPAWTTSSSGVRGARAGRSSAVVTGELSSGPERPPCLCFCRFLRAMKRLAGRRTVTARICAIYNWHGRLYIRNSRFYSTRTDPNSFANPNFSLHIAHFIRAGARCRGSGFFSSRPCGWLVCPCHGGGSGDAGESTVASPGRPVLRLDRPLCGRPSRLCLGAFELERATRSLEFARPRPILRYLQRVGSYFGGLQIGYDYMLPNRVVLWASRSIVRFRAFQISTASPSAASRSSPRRRSAWRAIANRCCSPAPCARARRLRSRQLALLWDRRLRMDLRPTDADATGRRHDRYSHSCGDWAGRRGSASSTHSRRTGRRTSSTSLRDTATAAWYAYFQWPQRLALSTRP